MDEWLQRGVDDATWVLTSSFVILTMQSGFGLLESGCMPMKHSVNIMMKNVIDVIFGGLSYWLLGYGMSYGSSLGGFVGVDRFCPNVNIDPADLTPEMLDSSIDIFSHYIFQFAFASTATTIVSGAVAGRLKFRCYIVFSFFNTLVYCVAAHWVFHADGWLAQIGVIDFAGDGPVHLLGAVNAAVGAWMVGPRAPLTQADGRMSKIPSLDKSHTVVVRAGPEEAAQEKEDGSPVNCIFGLFLLWWGWLGFNCGSTFGISGRKWLVASRVAVTTINASIGGGVWAVFTALWQYRHEGYIVPVGLVVNSILAGLVSITAGCAAVHPAEALLIGAIGAAASHATNGRLVKKELVDDPVGAIGVHGSAAIWGLLAVAIFADSALVDGPADSGLVHGGGFKLLGVQSLCILTITAWTLLASWLLFKALDLTIGLRAGSEEENVGFDWAEHRVAKYTNPEVKQMRLRIEQLEEQVRALQKNTGVDQMRLRIEQLEEHIRALPPVDTNMRQHSKRDVAAEQYATKDDLQDMLAAFQEEFSIANTANVQATVGNLFRNHDEKTQLRFEKLESGQSLLHARVTVLEAGLREPKCSVMLVDDPVGEALTHTKQELVTVSTQEHMRQRSARRQIL